MILIPALITEGNSIAISLEGERQVSCLRLVVTFKSVLLCHERRSDVLQLVRSDRFFFVTDTLCFQV